MTTSSQASPATLRSAGPSLAKLIAGVPAERRLRQPADALVIIGRQLELVMQDNGIAADIAIGTLRFSLFRLHQGRIGQLAPHCRSIIVYGEADVEPPDMPGIEFVALPPGSPLSQEWFLIIDSAAFWGALITQAVPERTSGTMRRYLFDGALTADERVVTRANLLLSLARRQPARAVDARDEFANRACWARVAFNLANHSETERLSLATALSELPEMQELLAARALPTEQLLSQGLGALQRHCGAAGGLVYRCEGDRLYPLAWSGPRQPSALDLRTSIAGQAIERIEPVLIALEPSDAEQALLPQAQSLIAVPLIVHERPWGVLMVGQSEAEPRESPTAAGAIGVAALLEQFLASSALPAPARASGASAPAAQPGAFPAPAQPAPAPGFAPSPSPGMPPFAAPAAPGSTPPFGSPSPFGSPLPAPGAAPSFGSPPPFGSPAPAPGAAPSFGSPPPFGSPPLPNSSGAAFPPAFGSGNSSSAGAFGNGIPTGAPPSPAAAPAGSTFGLPAWMRTGPTAAPVSPPAPVPPAPAPAAPSHEGHADANWAALQKRLMGALVAFDQRTADQIWVEASSKYAIEQVCTELLMPVQIAVGEGWHRGEVSVAAEHFCSRFVEVKLLNLLNANFDTGNGPLAVVGCAQAEMHELGAMMLALFLRWSGFRVIYLGQNVPNSTIEETMRHLRPQVLALSAATVEAAHNLTETGQIICRLEHPRPVFVFGGMAFYDRPDLKGRIAGQLLEGDVRQIIKGLAEQFREG